MTKRNGWHETWPMTVTEVANALGFSFTKTNDGSAVFAALRDDMSEEYVNAVHLLWKYMDVDRVLAYRASVEDNTPGDGE